MRLPEGKRAGPSNRTGTGTEPRDDVGELGRKEGVESKRHAVREKQQTAEREDTR